MGKMLLGLAAAIAATAIASPANAGIDQPFVGIPNANPTVGFSGMPAPGFVSGVTVHSGFGGGFGNGFDRRSRNSGGSSGGVWVNGGEWARYNNQTFASNSYNDWWHEQPAHSQPAWVRNNADCAKPYFQGNVLSC